jgi:orotate phosphoribosyltransferase
VTELASADLRARVYDRVRLTGVFPMRLGGTSDEFFDNFRLLADPSLLREVAEQMVALVPAETEVIAGPELAGVPLVTMLSQLTGLPSAWLRKVAKDYGTCRLVEGADITRRRVVVIEPFVKTGDYAAGLCAQLRERGAIVTDVLCIVDFERGSSTRLAAAGVGFGGLFTLGALAAAATP